MQTLFTVPNSDTRSQLIIRTPLCCPRFASLSPSPGRPHYVSVPLELALVRPPQLPYWQQSSLHLEIVSSFTILVVIDALKVLNQELA
ncbi:hypothetical protein KC19_6G079900 [Ceratodon purpureus]|uniref:Uncharacterized protein n=1 Tax=Ceratodon purpureus TaxID=3225 RepID=A0A8T0HG55_CERPU|nr:hypothetical protein KC19_6G079900 [Ceratodon purpureus]